MANNFLLNEERSSFNLSAIVTKTCYSSSDIIVPLNKAVIPFYCFFLSHGSHSWSFVARFLSYLVLFCKILRAYRTRVSLFFLWEKVWIVALSLMQINGLEDPRAHLSCLFFFALTNKTKNILCMHAPTHTLNMWSWTSYTASHISVSHVKKNSPTNLLVTMKTFTKSPGCKLRRPQT